MFKIKTSTKCLLIGTVMAGSMFANSLIKTEKEALSKEKKIENINYNPLRSPATLGAIFALGIGATIGSAGSNKTNN